jgi:hypothetical protein
MSDDREDFVNVGAPAVRPATPGRWPHADLTAVPSSQGETRDGPRYFFTVKSTVAIVRSHAM